MAMTKGKPGGRPPKPPTKNPGPMRPGAPKGPIGGGGKPGKMMPGAPAGRGSFGQVPGTPGGKKPSPGKKPIPGPGKGR